MRGRPVAALLFLAVALAGCLFDGSEAAKDIRVAIRQPSSVDPVKLRDGAGILVARQVFETMADFDPRTSALVEGMAEWETHDGGSRFVFRLKPGTKFHSGRDVTAEDVRFSLNRLAGKDTGSEVAFLLDSVAGFERVNTTGEATELEGVQALDATTLEIRTSAPWMDFPYVLTHPSTAPIPRGEFEADPGAFERQLIGTGPYSFTAPIQPGRNIQLARVGTPHRGIRRVDFVIYDRTEDAYRDFEEERVTIAEVPPSKIGVARAKHGEAGFAPVSSGIYLGFNLANPKFADVRLRRAISMGIDRVVISESMYAGAISPATGLVPERIPGRNPKACSGDCTRDIAKASALVREVFPEGAPPIAYDHPAGEPNEAIAKSLVADLAEIGIRLEPRSRQAEVTAYFDLIAAGGQEMFLLPWPGEYPHPDWFLNPLFRSGSSDNHTQYSVVEVDDLLNRARAAPNLSERLALYGQIEQRVLADMPVIPVGFFRSRFVASDEIDGFHVDALGGFEISRLGS